MPNLFPPDEKAAVIELVRAAARTEGKGMDQGTSQQMFNYFGVRFKKLLHVVQQLSCCSGRIGCN